MKTAKRPLKTEDPATQRAGPPAVWRILGLRNGSIERAGKREFGLLVDDDGKG
jgi:hypothetical protein